MNNADGTATIPRILALYDGFTPAQSLIDACQRMGVDLIPYVECMPMGPTPCLLMAPAIPWRLSRALSGDFSGFIEVAPDRAETIPAVWKDCAATIAQGGIAVSLTTAAAYGHDIPCQFMNAVSRRFDAPSCQQSMELALYEALSNAIIHGNLELDSSLRGSAAHLRAYRTALEQALSTPTLSSRRINLTCRPLGTMLRLEVHDQGRGWDVRQVLDTPLASDAKSGRGLDLIRRMAQSVAAMDCGRRLIMDFRRDQS